MSHVLWRAGIVGKPKTLTKASHLPDAIKKFEREFLDLKPDEKGYLLNWDNNHWPKDGIWFPDPDELVTTVFDRMQGTDKAGLDAFVRTSKDGKIVRLKAVEKDFGGSFDYSGTITPKCSQFCAEVVREFPAAELWGIYNPRYIAGTTTLSQHFYGNAVDWHFDTMNEGDEFHRWTSNNKGKFDIAHSLWRVEDHFDHEHDDFNPQGTGGSL